jgi:hypothetical protein
MKYKTQTLTVTLPHLTEWLNQKKLVQNKKLFLYKFPLPPPLSHHVPVYALPLSLHNTVHQFTHTAHACNTHTHTHTHTPLKTQSDSNNASLNPQAEITANAPHQRWQNTLKILLFQVTVTPLHKLNTNHTATQQQQFLWLSTAYTQAQVEYNIHTAPIQMCVA